MTTINTKAEATNINADVYENGKRITTIDEKTERSIFQIQITEEVDANLRPKVIALNGYANGLMQGRIVNDQTDIVIGVIDNTRALINTKPNIIRQGIVVDPGLVGGALGQEIYVNTTGELDIAYNFFKIGRLIQLNPAIVYINIGEERSQDLTFSEGLNNLESSSQTLENALRKIAFFSHKKERAFNPGIGTVVDIVFGNGLFVAISNNGTQNSIATSPNGENWTIRPLPVTVTYPTFSKIAFGGGIFLAISSAGNKFAYSSDGITWAYTSVSGTNYQYVFALREDLGAFSAKGFYVVQPTGAPPNSSLYYPYSTMSPVPKINTAFVDMTYNPYLGMYEGPTTSGMATWNTDLTSYNQYFIASVTGMVSIANSMSTHRPYPVSILAGVFPGPVGKLMRWDMVNSYLLTGSWQSAGVPNYTYTLIKYFTQLGLFVAISTNKLLYSSDGYTWEEKDYSFPATAWTRMTCSDNGLLAMINNTSLVYIGCLI